MIVVKIPKGNVKELYYKSRRIKFPKGSKYEKFSFFISVDRITMLSDVAEIILNRNVFAKADNKRLEFTANNIEEIFSGKDVNPIKEYIINKDVVLESKLSHLKERLPQEMLDMPNWVVYRTKKNERKGRLDKILISPITKRWAVINDSSTWSDFDTAKEFAVENNFKGVSFALNGKGITCIDLDDSIIDEKFSVLADKFIKNLPNAFTEISTSGKGLHFFVKDDILQGETFRNRVSTKDGEIEVYDNARFISMSGNVLNDINVLSNVPDTFKQELRSMLGKKIVQNSYRESLISMNDADVISRIRNSKKGKEFEELMNGVSQTGDKSRDDMKLLNMLAFFTDCNKGQMESIFKSSGLYREEKGQAYINLSIDKAVSTLTSRIKPKYCKIKK